MSIVKNKKIFKDFSSFSIHTVEGASSKINCLGYYDPNSMRRHHDPRYQEGLGRTHCIYDGKFVGGTWTASLWNGGAMIYDDHYLHDKPCVFLFFKHYPFGNGFLSKRLTEGHWHNMCIVSCNEVSVLDCMRVDTYENIFFLGKLREGMPIIDGPERHYLYVIEGEDRTLDKSTF